MSKTRFCSSWLLYILLLLCVSCITGCEDEKQKFNVGDTVCITNGDMIGTVTKVDKEGPSGNTKIFYEVTVYKKNLKGNVVYTRKTANDMNKFVEDPR
jgi:hypothetical protein|tara:strand:- start:595 stop:888 length:294 start_codon:yes stop_codon:yes gene_type:complete